MSKFFKDIDEFKKFALVNVSMDFADLDPILGIEEEMTIKKYLGQAQFDALADDYDNPPLSTEGAALLEKVRQPLALIALSENQFTRNIQESSSGSHKSEGKDRKPASSLSVARRKSELLKNGYKAIDILIDFLNTNKADYPDWANSDAYIEIKGLFIYTTKQLTDNLPIPQSHALFLQYKPLIKERERVVKGRIGKEFYEELKTQNQDDTLTPENKIIVEQYIRPALSWLAHAKAVYLFAKVHPFGIYMFEELNLDPSAKVINAAAAEKDTMQYEANTQAECILQDMLDFLAENIADYPTYENSPAYTPPETEEECECPEEEKPKCNPDESTKIAFL